MAFKVFAAVTAAAIGATVTAGGAGAQPAPELPTPDQLTGVLSELADPAVPAAGKNGLVDGGLDAYEGQALEHELRRASRNGDLPLSFTERNIAAAGPNIVTADVTVTGPRLSVPFTTRATFVNHGGWRLAHNTVIPLLEQVTL